MCDLIIYGQPSCPAVQKLVIAAAYARASPKVVAPAPGGPESVKLVTPEGCEILGAAAGLRYFARMSPFSHLYGRSSLDMSLVDSCMHVVATQILTAISEWVAKPTVERANSVAGAVNKFIEPLLLHQTFLVGERLTIADLHLACSLAFIQSAVPTLLNSCPQTQRWLRMIQAQPLVAEHLKVKAPGAACAPAADPVEKENKPEAAPKPKAASGKVVNPLDLLPPSSMNLDAWKREYSNSKDLRGQAMPWFWKNFDAEGYSMWYMRYEKLPTENKVNYVTCNMLNGFLQRIDNNFRRYSFGVINVVGEPGDYDILGVWMVRGQELPAEFREHVSYEIHSFRKLDMSKPEEKVLVEDYWCNDDVVEGRPIDSSKVWK